jgi:hypothetical protein
MDILINNKTADITLDTEKTLGDVLSGLDLWLSPSGNRINSIKINGEDVPVDALAGLFDRDIGKIKKLELIINSWRELAAEALGRLLEICIFFEKVPFDERKQIADDFEGSSAARFLSSDIPEILACARSAFSGEGLPAADLAALLEERLREVINTGKEIENSENLVKTVAQRMEELPLDMQTGKDRRAAETIQIFSGIGEKLFRIFFIYKSEGRDEIKFDGLCERNFIDEFNAALRDLSDAYRNQDTVLAGDIAEYELAPRLMILFAALKETANSFPID